MAKEPASRRLLNATGILLHTNLGRARMDEFSSRRAAEVAANCFDLEFSRESGRRGDRFRNLRWRLRELVACEDALVVNNNAAAVLLAVNALAEGKEVLVSRRELVEIGGSFRIPEIVQSAGAQLRLVGAANRCERADWLEAIGAETKLILKVHQSNFRQVGESFELEQEELLALSREREIPFVEDLGSGCFFDLSKWGLPPEPTVAEMLGKGVDLLTFSGDKLLGGPQCGVIVGKSALVEKLRSCPLLRTMRVGKVIDALLCECLDRYIEGRSHEIPFIAMLQSSVEELEARAKVIVDELSSCRNLELEMVESRAQVGAGACPEYGVSSRALLLASPKLDNEELKRELLRLETAIVARIERDSLVLDLRSLLPEDDQDLLIGLRCLEDRLEKC